MLKAMLPAYQKKKYRGSAYLSGRPVQAPAPSLLLVAAAVELASSSDSAFGSFFFLAGVVVFFTAADAGSFLLDFESAAFSFLAGGVAAGFAGVAFFFTAGLLLLTALFGVALEVEAFFGEAFFTAGLFGAASAVVERAMFV